MARATALDEHPGLAFGEEARFILVRYRLCARTTRSQKRTDSGLEVYSLDGFCFQPNISPLLSKPGWNGRVEHEAER
jgi:hypothetical protein